MMRSRWGDPVPQPVRSIAKPSSSARKRKIVQKATKITARLASGRWGIPPGSSQVKRPKEVLREAGRRAGLRQKTGPEAAHAAGTVESESAPGGDIGEACEPEAAHLARHQRCSGKDVCARCRRQPLQHTSAEYFTTSTARQQSLSRPMCVIL